MEVWSDRLNCVVRLDSLSERIKSKRSYPLLIGEIMVIEELLSQNLTQSAETQKGTEPLVCSELNLTANGRNSAVDFSVTFHGWEQEQCIELLNGLRMYNISAFNLEFKDLNSLESLKIVGVDFEMGNGQEIALWTTTLRRLHIEYSSIRNLPWWLSRQIQSLSYVNVKANRLTDLSLISFSCESVQEMDLSENNVSKFAQHTFAQCRQLRVLDLSHNAISKLPPKGFTNTKLKHLKLAHNRIKTLKADHLTGLNGLRSLSLSGNPLDGGIDLFAFLPVKWMKSIEMDGCNLTQLPLALTQCCLLTSLSVNNNLFYTRDSMPAEVLALLSHLRHLGFERNPLKELPPGIFIFNPTTGIHNNEILAEILDTLIQLPVWIAEPCTPFMWNLHLANSSEELRERVSVWNKKRMHREKLGHCQQLYETIIDGQGMYRELVENSGCEASRRLRSVENRQHRLSIIQKPCEDSTKENCACNATLKATTIETETSPDIPTLITPINSFACENSTQNLTYLQIQQIAPNQVDLFMSSRTAKYIVLTSLIANLTLFLVIVAKVLLLGTKQILCSPSMFNISTKRDGVAVQNEDSPSSKMTPNGTSPLLGESAKYKMYTTEKEAIGQRNV
ncbi:leucine rich repeat domain-containing protein [Ditylenchus destructor]|nr:leucine rich repeat domain-containing protein [Ditylenchus destructor]